jgi:hypothetical protein
MKLFLTAFAFHLVFFAGAQISALQKLEVDMAAAQLALGEAENDEARFAASDQFRTLMIEALNSTGCFDYPFDSIQTISKMHAPDRAFRLFNWNVPRDDRTHKYYCFVLTSDPETGIYDWTELSDNERFVENIESKVLTPEQWMGCLYYDIIPIKEGRKTENYILLGWDGNNRNSSKKIIDVLSFNRKGVRLGAPIFKSEMGTAKRVILEYSSDVQVSVKWHAKEQRIVFDHLAPRDPMMTGVRSYYGPDMTFDAYVLKKGKLEFHSNVDIRLGKDHGGNKPYALPPK